MLCLLMGNTMGVFSWDGWWGKRKLRCGARQGPEYVFPTSSPHVPRYSRWGPTEAWLLCFRASWDLPWNMRTTDPLPCPSNARGDQAVTLQSHAEFSGPSGLEGFWKGHFPFMKLSKV